MRGPTGELVRVPAGTKIFSTAPGWPRDGKCSKRALTTRAFYSKPDVIAEGTEELEWYMCQWSGRGGYWKYCEWSDVEVLEPPLEFNSEGWREAMGL